VSGQSSVTREERGGVFLAFATLLGILASYAVLETARDALFLARLSPNELPWVYLVMAALAVVLAQLPGKSPGIPRSHRLSATLAFGAAVTLGFYFLRPTGQPWLLRAFYVWSGAIVTLAGVQFWVLLGEIYTITQAKRLYRAIGTGSLVGAALGAGLARLVSGVLPADSLIAVGAALMAATAGLTFVLARRVRLDAEAPAPTYWRLRDVPSFLQREPYVTRLAGVVLVSSVAVTLGDYVFKSEVAHHVAADGLAPFFATFYGVLSLLALVVQVALMGWILRVLDVHRALLALPMLMLGGAAGVVLGGGLVAALVMKGTDGALRPSLNRTSTELLFLPIPDYLRSRVKPAIDVMGQRGGQALASLFILSQLALGRGDHVVSIFVAVLCVAWIAAIGEMRPHYVEMFRRALREGLIEARGGLPDLDLVSLEALFASLNSRDDTEVIAALDLLHVEGRTRLVPALILYHPTPAVVLRALELFDEVGRTDFLPVADRLIQHPDPEVRAAALRALATGEPDDERLRAALGDESPVVRATALALRLAETPPGEDAGPLVEVILGERDPEARRALARAIERKPVPAFVPVLESLVTDPQDEVQVSAARSIGILKDVRFLPALLEQLRRETVRPEARRSLQACGAVALEFLERSLEDVTLPQELRRHIPRAVASFPALEAIPVLQRHLLPEQDGMVRYRILRALGRVATRHPEVPLDEPVLIDAAGRTVETLCRIEHWRSVLEDGAAARPARRTPGHTMLAALLRDKSENAQERLFRLLDLIDRQESFRQIYRGLHSSDRRVQASSLELLENILQPPLKAPVLALVNGPSVPPAVRREATAPFYRPERLDYDTLLVRLIEQPGETLRSLAVFHVGELGLRQLRDRIVDLRSQETSLFVGQMYERTLRALKASPEGSRAS
jgi:AAA family ATP:ADP antiporter